MCGYVGFIDETEAYNAALSSLNKMTDAIAHRGPDDSSFYTEAPVALGFRRLSIIDLAGGRQPMLNDEQSLVLLFNGEIYNYQSIRKELIEKGYRFKTQADSEVLLHGYAEYGTDLPHHLRGMFSFVIWDKQNNRLFGARDPFGIKPFYYAEMGSAFLFGSEIKSFLEHPAFEKRFNHKLLPGYLSFQYTPPCNETFFEGVYKLPPAHAITWEHGKLTIEPYEVLEFTPDPNARSISSDEWTDRIEQAIANSVVAHKISDVEVGSFLSSGVDSSYVASIADVDKTFTVGFDNGTAYNEISYAEELSEQIGVKNFSKIISSEEYWDAIDDVMRHMDEPVADPSAVALYFLAQLASQHCKVVLSGEGADELFGGYNIYCEPLTMAAYNVIPLAVRRLIAKIVSKLPAHRGLNFLVRRGEPLETRYIGNANYIFKPKESAALLKDCPSAPAVTDYTKPFYDRMLAKDPSTRMQTLDLNCWLTGDILQKADKMSMAHSLELRVPFLDREVWAVAKTLPVKERTNKKVTKIAFRRAARRHLPEKWAAKRKLGFPVPMRVWLREDAYYNRVKETFLSPTASVFFNTDQLVKLLDDHKAEVQDNSRKIYTVYAFLVWYRVYFEA